MRKTKEAALRTREKILLAALDAFSEKSFAGASVVEIASKIGMTKGAFYWHFKNKEDLIFKLIEEMCKEKELHDVSIVEAAEAEPIATLRKYFTDTLAVMRDDEHCKKIHKIMLKQDEWPRETRENVLRVLKKSLDNELRMVERLVQRGREQGRIKKDLDAAAAAKIVTSVLHGLCMLQLSDVLGGDVSEHIELLFDAFDSGWSVK